MERVEVSRGVEILLCVFLPSAPHNAESLADHPSEPEKYEIRGESRCLDRGGVK
jgi:hypothetical protein